MLMSCNVMPMFPLTVLKSWTSSGRMSHFSLACYHGNISVQKRKVHLKLMEMSLVLQLFDQYWTKWNFELITVPNEKSESPNTLQFIPRGGMNVCSEFHGNPSNSCWDILLRTTRGYGLIWEPWMPVKKIANPSGRCRYSMTMWKLELAGGTR